MVRLFNFLQVSSYASLLPRCNKEVFITYLLSLHINKRYSSFGKFMKAIFPYDLVLKMRKSALYLVLVFHQLAYLQLMFLVFKQSRVDKGTNFNSGKILNVLGLLFK